MSFVARIVWALLLGACLALSVPAAPALGPTLAAPLDVDQGELLWNQLNCAACHSGASNDASLTAHVGPVLGEGGIRVTPQFFRAYLENPEGEKPGTTMPDMIPAAQKAEAVEALMHFLSPAKDEETGVGSSAIKIAQGRKLYHTIGCVACHAPEESWQSVMGVEKAEIDPQLLGTNSVPFGNLARKYSVGELAKFLIDPVKYRKAGRMPSLKLSGGEAQAVAMYLLRAQASDPSSPQSAPKTLAGLQYEYFESGIGGSDPNWDALKPVSSGTIETFNVEGRRREQNFGFRFSGVISIQTAGKYSFWLNSDDGSRLWIGDKLVVDNGGEHAPEEKSGSVELSAGLHPILLTFFNAGGGYELRVQWQAPGGRRGPIPQNLLAHMGQPMLPLGGGNFARDATKAEKGKTLFSSLGCAACHEHSEVKASAPAAKAFSAIASAGGCLDDPVKDGLPNYHFSAEQRKALRDFVANKFAREGPPSPEKRAWNRFAALNCVACHTREAKGGATNARLQYFFASGDADLGDEGRIPPHLTGVGLKLRADWMKQVLENGASVRPYMLTRMPQFGAAQVAGLPELLEIADSYKVIEDRPTTVRDEKFGRRLVGVGGLSCVSCHTFAGHKSLGVPAIDLTVMTKRLKRVWFERYVIDPPALRPGTRMPSFWPNGEAVNKEILDGKTDAQINAIWAYLKLGRDADLPPGLVQGKKEIVADKEAVIYRNFIGGAGPRAIGVGYPEKANLAFDANEVRIAEIWQGAFIDDARHSTGRGEGFENPLGDRIYKLPPGPIIAMLPNGDAPWPAQIEHQMRGYVLDKKQRPTFRYKIGDAEIEDFPVAVQGELDSYFTRTLRIKSNAPELWLRAAVAQKIEPQSDGSFLVDGKENFKLSAKAVVRRSGDKAELIAPIPLKDGSAEIREEIRW